MTTLSAPQETRASMLHRDALIIDSLSGEPTVFSPAMLARLDELTGRAAPPADILAEMAVWPPTPWCAGSCPNTGNGGTRAALM
ncbi:MAG: hypothetical protein ACT4PY_06050 [Armatimonadota bacterium]